MTTSRKGGRGTWSQGPGVAVALLLTVVCGGTLGFHWIEGWSLWHAFYATVLAVTTIGLPDLSPGAQVFSVVVLIAEVSTALYTFTLLATVVVERDAEGLRQATEDGTPGVEGDASRKEVLRRVGIDRARGMIAA